MNAQIRIAGLGYEYWERADTPEKLMKWLEDFYGPSVEFRLVRIEPV